MSVLKLFKVVCTVFIFVVNQFCSLKLTVEHEQENIFEYIMFLSTTLHKLKLLKNISQACEQTRSATIGK